MGDCGTNALYSNCCAIALMFLDPCLIAVCFCWQLNHRGEGTNGAAIFVGGSKDETGEVLLHMGDCGTNALYSNCGTIVDVPRSLFNSCLLL